MGIPLFYVTPFVGLRKRFAGRKCWAGADGESAFFKRLFEGGEEKTVRRFGDSMVRL
jgi:hypothetical protein